MIATACSAPTLAADVDQDGFGRGDEEGASATGLELGVRTGYGAVNASSHSDASVRTRIAGALPFGFDLGYRFHPDWFVGGYGDYAIGFSSETASSDCPDCTHTWLHLGVQVRFRFLELDDFNVWAGAGTGRHWLNGTLETEASRTETLSGPEYLNLQLGSSWQLSEGLAIGPYTTVSFGAVSEGVEHCREPRFCPAERRELDVNDAGTHLWLTTGVRFLFLP